MGEQMYEVPSFTPAPQRKSKTKLILGVIGAAVALCLGGVTLAAMASGGSAPSSSQRSVQFGEAVASAVAVPQPTPTPGATPGGKLTVKDVKLTIKTKSKQCFGSAGCNIEFTVVAATDFSKLAAGKSYDVTYDVKGDESGVQTHTLTLNDDGTYNQDGYQSASTPSKSTKLTVVVTDVQENL